jgi:hypothetical protein
VLAVCRRAAGRVLGTVRVMSAGQIPVGTLVTVAAGGEGGRLVTGRVYRDTEGTLRVCGSHEGTSYDPAADDVRNADGTHHACDAVNVTRDADGFWRLCQPITICAGRART